MTVEELMQQLREKLALKVINLTDIVCIETVGEVVPAADEIETHVQPPSPEDLAHEPDEPPYRCIVLCGSVWL